MSSQRNVFIRQNTEQEAKKTSFAIAHKIVKNNKPFSYLEFIKERMIESSESYVLT